MTSERVKEDDIVAILREGTTPGTYGSALRLAAADEIERLRAQLVDSDSVIVYYVAKNWPSYSDRERDDKTWKPAMSDAQSDAFKRHAARWREAGAPA